MKNTLIEALDKTSKILMDNYHRTPEITIKENQSSILTQADLEAEKCIIDMIKDNFPGHTIISEETGHNDHSSGYCWVIDPIDGTSNFAAKLPWFGTLIALLKDSEVIMAGATLPYYNLTYFAEKGKGATRNGKAINVTKEKEMKNTLFSYSIDYSDDGEKIDKELRIIKHVIMNSRNIRSTNSLVDFCYVADGRLGGCINQGMKIWDIAAPLLIIKEAGGVVTDVNGNDISFKLQGKDIGRNYTGITCAPEIHQEVLNLIKDTYK